MKTLRAAIRAFIHNVATADTQLITVGIDGTRVVTPLRELRKEEEQVPVAL